VGLAAWSVFAAIVLLLLAFLAAAPSYWQPACTIIGIALALLIMLIAWLLDQLARPEPGDAPDEE
jgi:hypothetical protein